MPERNPTRLCVTCKQVTWRESGECDTCAAEIAEQREDWWA